MLGKVVADTEDLVERQGRGIPLHTRVGSGKELGPPQKKM